MIVYEGPGDLFTCHANTILCPVNSVGVMGKGLALAFKKRVPGLYEYYRQWYFDNGPPYTCAQHLRVYRVDDERRVLLFPTKDDWRHRSSPELIEANLKTLVDIYQAFNIWTLGIPLIGCGKDTGGLDWETEVRPLVYRYLDPLPDIAVHVLTGP